MTRIQLIRHARPVSTWSEDLPDPGLNEVGREQAAAAAGRLLALDDRRRPSRVVSSPFLRCRETAEPLARALGVEIEIEAACGEIPTPGSLAPSDRSDWLARAMAGCWRDIEGDIDYPAWRRAAFEAMTRHPGAAVYSHFVALNAVVSLLRGCEAVVVFRPGHAAVTTLARHGSTVVVEKLGEESATPVL